MSGFTERSFRDALGQFATGVAIVTAEVSGQRLGSTVSSFNAVSLAPPLVLFSLARSARSLPAWQAAQHYGVTILADHQIGLSNRFAKSGDDKWQAVEATPMKNGAPLLPGWLCFFECDAFARYDGGDHEIFVAKVTHFETRTDQDPLIFHGGKYRNLASTTLASPPRDADVWLHGW